MIQGEYKIAAKRAGGVCEGIDAGSRCEQMNILPYIKKTKNIKAEDIHYLCNSHATAFLRTKERTPLKQNNEPGFFS